jgi:DNA-binding transcriptional LysR family regulator
MALRPAFDLDLLRTLVFIAEEASFTKAADRVGRTQSAVTLQVQRLETLVRQPLLVRSKGGPVVLTPQGRILVDRARAMLELNDETFRALDSRDFPATMRLGVSSYYAPFFLTRSQEAMRGVYPNVLLEIINGKSCQLVLQLKEDAFDLIVVEGGLEPRNWQATEIWRAPLRWITATAHTPHLRDPLPLCLLPSDCPWRPPGRDDCFWRSAALRALERAGRKHRVVAVTDSMDTIYATVAAGEAISISVDAPLPAGVRAVGNEEGLPALPETSVAILKGRNPTQPLTDAAAELIRANFRVG